MIPHSDLNERKVYVKDTYEHLWTETRLKAEKLIAEGETDLSRITLLMRRDFGPDYNDAALIKKNQDRDKDRKVSGFIFDGQVVKPESCSVNIYSLLVESLKNRYIVEKSQGAQRIIELGAGWGKNLFKLWLYGAPVKAEYSSFELTDSGRDLFRKIANHAAPQMNLKTYEFDYYDADFSALTDNVPTIVFTHHSLEQITNAPKELFERIAKIPGLTEVLHLEPVGFQWKDDLWLKQKDKKLMAEIDAGNKKFAEKRGQNGNLYAVLKDLEKQGTIEITEQKKYYCSSLMNNATSILAWKPR